MDIARSNAPEAPRELVFTRTFAAPPEQVWRAWTEPALLAQWWGPQGFTNPVCEIESRPGGAIRIDMTAPDGTVYPMGGTVHEFDPPRRLVFTSTAHAEHGGPALLEAHNVVTFEPVEGGTLMRLEATVTLVRPEMQQALEGMQQGWSQSLERLTALLDEA